MSNGKYYFNRKLYISDSEKPWYSWASAAVVLAAKEKSERWTEQETSTLELIGFKKFLSLKFPFKHNRTHDLKFGITLYDGDFTVYYGKYDSMSWDSTHKSKSFRFPWLDWQFIKYRYYDESGEKVVKEFSDTESKNFILLHRFRENLSKKLRYRIRDYDGEEIIASCYIVERTWKRGRDAFSWISLFCKDIVRKDLEVSFESEVGSKKGSWKGGLCGRGIEMYKGELPTEALRRICAEENLKLIERL